MTEKETSPNVIDALAPIAALAARCKAVGEALKTAGAEVASATGHTIEAQRADQATPFDRARAHLMGKRWTEQEAAHLKEIIDQGTAWTSRE